LRFAALRINRLQEPGNVVHVTADANQHVVAHHQGRHGGPVSLVVVGDLDVPADFAVFGIQRNEVGIGSGEKQPALVHGNAAMPDVQAWVGRIGVMPDLMSGARIDCPDVVRHGEVQDAVDQKRRRLQFRFLPGLERPGQPQ
jgi:hypothetical protein